jgi:hypothetical protein
MTQPTHKPVRKCHGCLLNLGDHCWGYAHPRTQWRRKSGCHGCADEAIHQLYRLWKKQAVVKSRREIRREYIHHLPPQPVYHLEKNEAARLNALREALS